MFCETINFKLRIKLALEEAKLKFQNLANIFKFTLKYQSSLILSRVYGGQSFQYESSQILRSLNRRLLFVNCFHRIDKLQTISGNLRNPNVYENAMYIYVYIQCILIKNTNIEDV